MISYPSERREQTEASRGEGLYWGVASTLPGWMGTSQEECNRIRFKAHPAIKERRNDRDGRETMRVNQREKAKGRDWAERDTGAEILS